MFNGLGLDGFTDLSCSGVLATAFLRRRSRDDVLVVAACFENVLDLHHLCFDYVGHEVKDETSLHLLLRKIP